MLEDFGILGLAPYRHTGEPTEPAYHWVASHAPKKHFERTSANKAVDSNKGFKVDGHTTFCCPSKPVILSGLSTENSTPHTNILNAT